MITALWVLLSCAPAPAPAPAPGPAPDASSTTPPSAGSTTSSGTTSSNTKTSSDPVVVQPVSAPDLKDRLTAASSKPRLYNFWATWCGPCVGELPTLVRFAKDHPEIDVVFVDVDARGLRQTHVIPFAKRYGLDGYTVWQLDADDPADAVMTAVDQWPDSIPVTLFVNTKGERVRQFNGSVEPRQLDEGLAAATK